LRAEDPLHQLGPGVISGSSAFPVFIIIEELVLGEGKVELDGSVGSAIRDDRVAVGSAGSETTVIDDQVFMWPWDQGGEPLQELVLGENEVGGAVAVRRAQSQLDSSVIESREPRLG